jgi:DNA-binding response OmpR family regulator
VCTVLLVDDEPDIRTIARLQLQGGGHDVIEARDGREALELARLEELGCERQVPKPYRSAQLLDAVASAAAA